MQIQIFHKLLKFWCEKLVLVNITNLLHKRQICRCSSLENASLWAVVKTTVAPFNFLCSSQNVITEHEYMRIIVGTYIHSILSCSYKQWPLVNSEQSQYMVSRNGVHKSSSLSSQRRLLDSTGRALLHKEHVFFGIFFSTLRSRQA